MGKEVLTSKLEAKSKIDAVGNVGGMKVYIPSQIAQAKEFPFKSGEEVIVYVDEKNRFIVEKINKESLPSLKDTLRPAQIFVHDHSPLAKDCNPKCGWYALGKQLTSYNLAKKTQVKI
ncbi:MAG: hypothetical protein ABSD68_02700 [Candidatus Micrarchaeales archaeon]|jgi:hypothetical protein